MGLKFKLYSAETLFNKGLSQVYMGRIEDGLKDMREASSVKCTSEHNVIDEAIRDRAEGYTVFSIVRSCKILVPISLMCDLACGSIVPSFRNKTEKHCF